MTLGPAVHGVEQIAALSRYCIIVTLGWSGARPVSDNRLPPQGNKTRHHAV